jgi:transposase
LLTVWQRRPAGIPMVMDRAYEGDETRQLVLELGFEPVVPPNPNRLRPWTYDRSLYRRRNEVERLFRRLKGFRRIFSRFEKLDLMFTAFIQLALITDMLCVNSPLV